LQIKQKAKLSQSCSCGIQYNLKILLLVLLWPPAWKWNGSILEVKKGKGFPYSLPSIGPGADPDVQAVSSQVSKKI